MRSSRKLVVLAAAVMIGGANAAMAGRPMAIDDADPADQGRFEFEAGAAYEHDGDCKHWDFPVGLAYGLAPRVEVGVGLGGQLEERTEVDEATGAEDDCTESGVGDLGIGAKWQVIEACPLGARHAIVPSVKIPAADEDKGLGSGETDYDLTWIISRSLGEKAGVHINVGYSWVGKPETASDVLHYGLALDYQVANAVQWVGEVFAEEELCDGADTVVMYNTGFRWNATDSLTLDIAGGSRISGEAADWAATIGLTYAFGFGGGVNP